MLSTPLRGVILHPPITPLGCYPTPSHNTLGVLYLNGLLTPLKVLCQHQIFNSVPNLYYGDFVVFSLHSGKKNFHKSIECTEYLHHPLVCLNIYSGKTVTTLHCIKTLRLLQTYYRSFQLHHDKCDHYPSTDYIFVNPLEILFYS